MRLVPPTSSRVPEQKAAHVNREIEEPIEASVADFAEHPDEAGWRSR